MNTADSQSKAALDSEPTQSLDDLEGSLHAEMAKDDRLNSGVSTPQVDSDLDFIEMTGLTTPAREPAVAEPAASDMDPSAPVSFYEKGVGDVDSEMDPVSVENAPLNDPEILASEAQALEPHESTSVASLKEIIADLSDEHGALETVEDTTQTDEIIEDPPQAEVAALATVVDELSSVEPESVAAEEPGKEEAEPPSQADSGAEDLVAEATPMSDESTEPAAPEPVAVEEPEPVPQQPEPPIAPEPVVTESAVVEKVAPQPVTPSSKPSTDLSEAETLLQELEAKEREDVTRSQTDEFVLANDPDWALPTNKKPDDSEGDDHEEADASVYSKPASSESGHSRRHHKSPYRRLIRLTFLFGLLALVGAGLWQAFQYVQYERMTAMSAYNAANAQLDSGNYAKASKMFLNMAGRFSDHPLRADAEFMAAVALGSTPRVPVEEGVQAYNASLTLFEQFINRHPTHEKVARAQTLLANTYFRLQRYSEAISILDDPNRRVLDPPAYLSTLRTLALSYIALGKTENARSAYLRAASLEGNYTADEDYIALATLYEQLAKRATTTEDQIRNQKRAVEAWDYAVRLPGILNARKKDIDATREIVVEQLRAAGAWDDDGMVNEVYKGIEPTPLEEQSVSSMAN